MNATTEEADDGKTLRLIKASSLNLRELCPRLTKTTAHYDDLLSSELELGIQDIGPSVSVLRFFPDDPSQFIVGTLRGELIRGCRLGQIQSPKYFVPEPSPESESVHVSAITSISFSPFLPSYFLAAYQSGLIRYGVLWNQTHFLTLT